MGGHANMTDAARRLKRRLECRPDKQQLIDNNVLKEGAPRLQYAQQSIKKEKLIQNLDHKVGQRPERGELLQRNILRGDEHVAPCLQAAQESLRREKLVHKLDRKLGNRPERSFL